MVSKKQTLVKGVLYSFFSALLLIATLPYLNLWWFVWIALVPFLVALRRESSLPSSLLLVMVFGVVYCIAIVAPLFQLTATWWSGSSAFSVFSFVLAVAFYGALFFLPLAYVVRKYCVSTVRDVFVIAFFWSVIEYVRSQYGLMGYGWGVVGYTLVDATYINAIARFIGVYGLSFLIVAINMFFVLIYERMSKNTLNELQRVLKSFLSPRERYWTVIFLVIWTLSIGYGAWRHYLVPARLSAPLHVAVVVTNSDDLSVGGGLYRAYRKSILDLLTKHPETSIVLFPENTFPFFQVDEMTKALAIRQEVQLDERTNLYEDFLLISKKYPTTIFAVGLHTIEQAQTYNSLVFYLNGEIVGILHKERLVPFFEYVPLGLPIPLYEPLTQGNSGQHITLSGNTLSMLMCSEISDGSITPSSVNIILSPSNDAVFASGMAGRVDDAFARMRAIESDAYLIRANKGSISSIIDPKGEILETGFGDVVLFETLH